MKNLIVLITLLSTLNVAKSQDCTVTLYKKKPGAKTSYTLKGDTISKKVVEKLSTQCKFNFKLFTPSEPHRS